EGWEGGGRVKSRSVVPANEGTIISGSLLLRGRGLLSGARNLGGWLGVPAFAGTTAMCLRNRRHHPLRHCEEPRDEAIQTFDAARIWRASLALAMRADSHKD